MNCVLTNAQIELISTDVSVVDYGSSKKRDKHNKGEFDDTPADANSIKRANEEWLSRYGDGKDAGKGLSIGDIFNGVKAETGIKLKE